MWQPDRSRLVSVRLHTCGQDVETTWAEDCGGAPVPAGARFVRLANVPHVYAKPTYGDVIVVAPDREGVLSWDSGGVALEEIDEQIIEDEGRWMMALEYALTDPNQGVHEAFTALAAACEAADIAAEGYFGPGEGEPGCVYLAVPAGVGLEQVLALLERQGLPLSLRLVHPVGDADAV